MFDDVGNYGRVAHFWFWNVGKPAMALVHECDLAQRKPFDRARKSMLCLTYIGKIFPGDNHFLIAICAIAYCRFEA